MKIVILSPSFKENVVSKLYTYVLLESATKTGAFLKTVGQIEPRNRLG